MIDYYQVLGVPLDASQALLRRAYLDQASNYHPFKKDNSQNSFDNFRKDSGINQTRFKLIAQAYTILGNDYWRRIYDSIALPKNSEENFNQSKTLYREDHHSRQNRESSSLPSEIACELVDLDPIKIFNRACAQQDEDRRQGRLDSSLISEFSRNKIFSPSSSSSSSSISSVSSSSRPSAISSSTNNSHGALVSKLKVPHSQLLPKDGLCNKTESNSGSSSDQRFNKPKSRKVSFSDQTIASDEIRMAREAVKAIKAEQSRNSALKVKQLEHIVPLENQTDTATILISENISRSRAHSMTDQISKLSLMERPEGDDVGEYQPLVQTSQNSERRRGAIMKNLASNRTTNPYNDNLDLHYQSAVYDRQARTSRELVDLDEQDHMKVNHTRNSEEIRMMNQIKTRPSVNRYRSGSSPTLPIRNDQKYALVLPNSSKSPEISARLSLKSFENFQTLQSDKPSDPSFSKDQQQYCDYQLKEVSKRTSFNSKPTEEFSTQTIKIQRNTGSSGKSKPSHSNYGQDQVESSQSLMLKSRLSKISMNSNEDETQTSKKIIDQLENFLMELDDRMGIFDRRMSKNLYRAGIKKVEWIIDLSYDELRKINERLKKSYHEERNQKKSSNETGGRSNGKGYDEKSEDFSERTDGKDSDDDYGEEDYYLSPFQEISLIKKLNEFKEKQKLV